MRNYYPKGRRNLCFDCAVYVAAVFLPPLAVFMVRGCHIDFAVNILLTIMGLIPGMIHAIYVVIKHPDKRFGVSERQLAEMNRVAAVEGGRVYPVSSGTVVTVHGRKEEQVR